MANFYIDINNPLASDNNPGTEQLPWSSFSRAFCAPEINPGDTVFIKQGVYYEEIKFGIQGTDSKKITFKAVPGHFVKVTLAKPVFSFNGHTGWADYFGDFQINQGQQFLLTEAQPIYESYICDSVEALNINGTGNRVFRIKLSNNFLQENDFVVFPALSSFLYDNIGTVDSYVLRVLKTENEYSYFNAGSSIPTSSFNDLISNKTFIRPSVRLGLQPGGSRNDATALSAANFRFRHYLDPRLYGNETWGSTYKNFYKNSLYNHPFNASEYTLSGNNDLFYGDNISIIARSTKGAWDNTFLGIGTAPGFYGDMYKIRNINGKNFTTWKVLSSSLYNVYVECFLSGGPTTYSHTQGLLAPYSDNGTRVSTIVFEDIHRHKNNPLNTSFKDLENKNSIPNIDDTQFGSFGGYGDNFGSHYTGVMQMKIREILNTYPKFTYTLLNNNLTLPPVSRDIKYIGYKTYSQYFQLTSISDFNGSKLNFGKQLENKVYPIVKLNRIDFTSNDITNQGLKYNSYSPYAFISLTNSYSSSGQPILNKSSHLTIENYKNNNLINSFKSPEGLYPLYISNFNFYEFTSEINVRSMFQVFKSDNFSKTTNSHLFSENPYVFNKGQNYPASYNINYVNNNVSWWTRLYSDFDPSRIPLIIIPYHSYPFGTLVFSGSSLSLSETNLSRLELHFYNQDRKNNLDQFRSLNITRILTAGSIVNFSENNSFYTIDDTTKNLIKQKDLFDQVSAISPFTDFLVVSSNYNANNKSTVVVLSSPQNYQINDLKVANLQIKAKNIVFEGIDFYAYHGYVENNCELFFGLTNAENLEFRNCAFYRCPLHLSNNVKNIKFFECDFYHSNEGLFYIYNVPGPVTFDSCNFKFFNKMGATPVEYASNVIDNYSKDILFNNCLFEDGFLGPAVSIINNCKNINFNLCQFKLINGPALLYKNNSNLLVKNQSFTNNRSYKFESFISNNYQISACGANYFICNALSDIKSKFSVKDNYSIDSYFNSTSSFDGQKIFAVYLPSSIDPNSYVSLRAVSALKFTTDENGLLSAFSGNQNILSFNYPELTFNSLDQTQKLLFDGNIFWVSEINSISPWVRNQNNINESLSAISEIKDCVFYNNECAIKINSSSNINIINNTFADNNYGIIIENIDIESSKQLDRLKIVKNNKILNNVFINNSLFINSLNDNLIKWKKGTKYFSYNGNPNDYCINGQYACTNIQLSNTLSAGGNNNWIATTNFNNQEQISLYKHLTSIDRINVYSNSFTETTQLTSDYNFYSNNNFIPLINPGTGKNTYFKLSSLPFILQKGSDINIPYPAYSVSDPEYLLYNNIPKTCISVDSNWSDKNSTLSAVNFSRNKYSELLLENKLFFGLSLSSNLISYNFEKVQGSSISYLNDLKRILKTNEFTPYTHFGPSIPVIDSDFYKNNNIVKMFKTKKTESGYIFWDRSTANISEITHFINNNTYFIYLTGSLSGLNKKTNLNVKRSFYDHFKY